MLQLGGILGIGASEHSGGGARSLGHGLAAIEDGYFAAMGGELESGGESDDAGARNRFIAACHRTILICVGPNGWWEACS